jgi:ubiquinone/menaquinone biosynthesis C-methylase UbiE
VLNCILEEARLVEVREGIFSALGEAERGSDYDSKVAAYDAVVGNRFYNRIVWGNWPSNYHDFCKSALSMSPDGAVLDAGCGSLVFTANAYAEANNSLIVLLDRSLGMLEKGKKRLTEICGSIPDHIVFIQGDIFKLPFRNFSFDSVVSNGVIHIFDDKERILTELERVKSTRGIVSFSSLVGNNRLGRMYLSALRKSGEVATVHSSKSLSEQLQKTPFKYELTSIGNMAYAKSV